MRKMIPLFLVLGLLNSTKAAAQLNFTKVQDTVDKVISFKVLPQNFYNQHLGFFCKQEVRLQKIAPVRIFFRLGSKEYVDWLERKPNAIRKN